MKQELTTNTRQDTIFKWTSMKTLFARLEKTELLEHVFLVLLGRICFMGYLVSPFCAAYFTAVFLKRRRPAYVISAMLGILSAGYATFSFKYGGTLLIICTICGIFAKELQGKKLLPAALPAGALFLNGMIYVVAEGFFAYDVLLLLCECGG
ncbi:MAG: hypothetical protein J6Q27_02400, partial [Clostridia bacterium]|nr:hypothetical protein [Clostridia bacterium]